MAVQVKRNVLFAALLAVLFTAGLVLLLRPLLSVGSAASSSDQAGQPAGTGAPGVTPGPDDTTDSGPGALTSGASTLPGGHTKASGGRDSSASGSQAPVRSVRVGGATLDNVYSWRRRRSRSTCKVIANQSAGVAVRITNVTFSAPEAFTTEACSASRHGIDEVVPCTPGVELAPPNQHPRQACGIRVTAILPGRQEGTLTLTTEATCTSRAVDPCTRLPAAEHPSAGAPVIAILEDQFQFIDADTERNASSPTDTPSTGTPPTSTPPTAAPTTSDPAPSSPDASATP